MDGRPQEGPDWTALAPFGPGRYLVVSRSFGVWKKSGGCLECISIESRSFVWMVCLEGVSGGCLKC